MVTTVSVIPFLAPLATGITAKSHPSVPAPSATVAAGETLNLAIVATKLGMSEEQQEGVNTKFFSFRGFRLKLGWWIILLTKLDNLAKF